MKIRFLHTIFALAATATPASANTVYFDGSNLAGNGNGAGDGLGGNWNTTAINWDQGDGLPRVTWDNSAAPGTTAVFGGPIGNNNRTVTVATVNAVNLSFSTTGTVGTGTRWTLSGGTLTLGDSVTRKASIDASAMLSGITVGVNVISTLAGDVSGGLTLIGSNFHGTSAAATPYAGYFNGLNPARVNLLSLSNLGTNSFTGPVTITNALEIQGLGPGNRYKALGPSTNHLTLNNGTILLYANNGILDQNIAVTGTVNALNLNNGIASSTVSGSITSGVTDVLWSVAGTNNGRLTYSGDLSGFLGTLKIKSSATGASVLANPGAFGGAIEVESGGTLQVGNNNATGTPGNAVLNDGNLSFNRTGATTYAGTISGTGTLTKLGAGLLTLSGNNTYSGITTVTAGRLHLTGGLAGEVNVSGGSISGSGSIAGKLTLRSDTAITLVGGATTTSLTVDGVEFFFPVSLDFVNAPVAATVYDVLTYGAGGVEFPEDFASFVRGTLNHDTVAKKFTFTAATPKSLSWNGNDGDWDQIATANWNAGAEKFHDWDAVTFNAPTAPTTVTLVGTLRPSSIAVTTSAGNDHTFSGTGSISGGTGITKSGDGTLILATANAYHGGTSVNSGTLRLQNPAGAGLGTITIGNSTLSLYRAGDTTNFGNQIISSAGTTGLLTVDGSGSDAGTGTNSTYNFTGIQVDGSLTITRPSGGRGATTYNGVLGGSGTLIIGDNNGGVDLVVENGITSRGRVFFANTTHTFNGHLRVLERGNFLNNSLNPTYLTLTVDAGAAITLLDQGAGSVTTTGRFNGAGIVARNTQTNQAVLAVGGANENDSFTGIIDAALFGGANLIGFTKNGTATQTLSGAGIRHNGTTTVNNGTLKLVDTTAWASNLAFGATDSPVLEFAGSESYIMGRSITGGSAFATLLKSSTGTLTLSGANPFTGGISVAAGSLIAGNNQAFGANGTTLTVADGAAIDTGGALNQNRDYHAIIQGAGIEGAGAILNSNAAANPTAGFRSLTLTADATIGGVGRWDVRPITAGEGLVDLAGNTLTKTGSNFIAFVNGTITGGTVNVAEGTLGITRNTWPVGTVNAAPGAILFFENNTAGQFSYGMNVSLASATLRTIGSNAETGGTLGLSGDSILDVAATFIHTQSGIVSGTGTLAKDGGGTFTLGPVSHPYAGSVTVNGGMLLINGAKTGTNTLTVATAATVGGSGTINGQTIIEAGGFVAPGDPAIGTLTHASATLAGTYLCQVDGATADHVNVTGTLTVQPGAAISFSTLAAPTEAEYIIATYGGISGATPESVNLPSGYQVDDSTPGLIKLVRVEGFGSWADSWTEPTLTDKAPGADPDNDGISNLLEYILGGDPRTSDTGILPNAAISGNFLVLSYKRSDASIGDTIQTGQWSTDLSLWVDIAPVVVSDNGDAPDDMEIRIPLSNAENDRLYGRLKASQTTTP